MPLYGDAGSLLAGEMSQMALHALPMPAFIVDPAADRIVIANAAACDLYGYSERMLTEELRFSQIHEDCLPQLIVFAEEVEEYGRAWTRSLKAKRADGRALSLEYIAKAFRTPQGRRLAFSVIDLEERNRRDTDSEAEAYLKGGLTEWRRVERFFREMERENQLILSAAGEGIYGVNAEGKTTFLNPAAERMLGWTADDLIGRDMHSIVHHRHLDGSHYPRESCPIYNAFRHEKVNRVEDEVFWRKDGRPIRVEYTSTPIKDRGVVVGAVVMFRDVTERRKAEEDLRQAIQEVERLRERLEMENAYLQEEILTERNHREIIGESAAVRKILQQIDLVASTDANVLVTGESGTGKELVARAIHQASNRRDRPLIRVNCAAIPRELFESEFFGHMKGAFTGALRDRIGRFELADGGTLFLDEVGEIPLDLQAKLLRVIQERRFERIGEERTRAVNVRIIAATNRDLKAEVRDGRFREDLFFRLNVFPIECTPLRERRSDIPLLAAHFLKTVCHRLNVPQPKLTRSNVEDLMRYDWPGNARELENVIERAAILSRNGKLQFDLPAGPQRVPTRRTPPVEASDRRPFLTEAERRQHAIADIIAALEACGGRVSGPGGAAEMLGVKPTTLYSRIERYGLKAR